MIEIQNEAIPLIFGCFFDASQIMGYTRKIDEFDPVIFTSKDRKGVVLKNQG